MREGLSHAWYCHASLEKIGYANRDEVILMYNASKIFNHGVGLEIGCYYAWTTAHFARNFSCFEVVDPILGTDRKEEIVASLRAADVLQNCRLHAGISPGIPIEIARRNGERPRWSFALLDGDHGYPAPLVDTVAVERYMLPESIIVFHDIYCPAVGEGLDYLKWKGWKTRACQTSNGVGFAWRGSKEPPAHHPDPKVDWQLPAHLASHVD
ncbi:MULTISPECIES: class I SAM-dependent methyltransferase [unclassified Methylobacterium]|uniref:class I SAM-dependent methyltransferase n=1 Tax=unclassified Methylobacterium TaxID=2615210 RepID=UPI0003768886|nr:MULTISPECIES: class I SAM-dependent methyltransferase [Methylobacterium]WFT80315.1 class I SAM-dependent methyltransferase [Methylobacterium nodulans]